MASNDPTILIILSEIIAIQAIVIIGAVSYFIVNKKKKKSLIEKSTHEFKENRTKRLELLTKIYEKSTPKNIDKFIDNILDKELTFHTSISNIFYKDKISEFITIDKSIYEMVIPYEELSESPQKEETNTEPSSDTTVPDIDNAIDELLSESLDDKNDINPALDLSGDTEELGIAEIPDELLNNDSMNPDKSNKKE